MAYDYQIGIIRAKESYLLSKTDWDRFLSTPSLRDVWAELVRLDLGYEEVGELELTKSIAKVYSKNISNLYAEICTYFLDENLKKAFLYEIDIYNLKLLYKQKKFDKNFSEYFIDGGYGDLKDLGVLEEFEKQAMTPYDFDVFLDSKLFAFRLFTTKNEFLTNIWKLKIDFYNLKLYVNKSENFIDGGNIENWKISPEELVGKFEIAKFALADNSLAWEKEEEKAILKYCEDAVMFFETVEPIIAYFFKRYIEIKNVNRLLYGRAFKLPNSKIEEQIS